MVQIGLVWLAFLFVPGLDCHTRVLHTFVQLGPEYLLVHGAVQLVVQLGQAHLPVQLVLGLACHTFLHISHHVLNVQLGLAFLS